MSLIYPVGVIAPQHQIARSLRFRGNAGAAYLSRTIASGTSRRKGTYSVWLKRGSITVGQTFLECGPDANNRVSLPFTFSGTADALAFTHVVAGAIAGQAVSTAIYRDPSAWMHVCWSWDTTVSANNVSLEVNGVATALTFPTTIAQNTDLFFGFAGSVIQNGRHTANASYYDGYKAEEYLIDGTKYAAADFGELNAVTGVWQPKAFSGSFGASGGYWKFADNSNTTAATLGKDSSGNGNDLTPNNFVIGNDSLVDTPVNAGGDTGVGGQCTGNYCTWNPIWSGAAAPTNGNLDSPSAGVARGTQALLSFDAYWEITSTGGTSTAGVVSEGGTTNTTTIATGKTYGFRLTTAGALDYKNITDAGAWTAITTGLTGVQYPYTSGAASTVASLNAGQRAFAATAPSGFKALCTQNLSDPAIVKPAQYFDTLLYTGNGSAAMAQRDITGLGFQPSLVWLKGRTGGLPYALYDSARGPTKDLELPGSPSAETTATTGLTAFNANGFGIKELAKINTAAVSHVNWSWKEEITAGLDIIDYTGDGVNGRTVGHNLGVTPSLVIVKERSEARLWTVYHSAVGVGSQIILNTNAAAAADAAGRVGGVSSTQITLTVASTLDNVNKSGQTYVAYAWAEVRGFSRFGFYVGNGVVDGPFVWCGFRPRWVLIKNVSEAGPHWNILDAVRDTYNPVTYRLQPNTVGDDSPTRAIDFTANGFKIRHASVEINSNGMTLIFAAFAEHPFKYARAR